MQMGRSDVGLLNVPLRLRPSRPDPKEQQAQVEEAKPEDQPKAPPRPVLENCPQCGTKLSPLDIKTNKCFKCWAILDAEAQDKPVAGRGFEVHI
jgi:hypothetical protein